jgi:hypothetical protein
MPPVGEGDTHGHRFETRLDAFMGNFVHDLGAVMHAATVVVGDQLGLYKALAEGPATNVETLAKPHRDRPALPARMALGPGGQRLRDSTSPPGRDVLAQSEKSRPSRWRRKAARRSFPGAFQIAVDQFKSIPKMVQAMRTGLGVGWHEHDAALFHGTERFFRPGYAANLVEPVDSGAEGMRERLQRRRAAWPTWAAATARPRC